MWTCFPQPLAARSQWVSRFRRDRQFLPPLHTRKTESVPRLAASSGKGREAFGEVLGQSASFRFLASGEFRPFFPPRHVWRIASVRRRRVGKGLCSPQHRFPAPPSAAPRRRAAALTARDAASRPPLSLQDGPVFTAAAERPHLQPAWFEPWGFGNAAPCCDARSFMAASPKPRLRLLPALRESSRFSFARPW